jgi:putative flippase GtrA
MIVTNPKERTRFLRFAIVGGIGAVIDIAIFNLLSGPLGVDSLIAQAVSFSVAVISNFTWNRLWTFPDARTKHVAYQLFQFVVVSVIGLILRTLIFNSIEPLLINLSDRILPPNTLSPVTAGHNLSLATVILIIMLWNFLVNRYWTYNDVQ